MTRQRFVTTWRGIRLIVGYEPQFLGGRSHLEIHVPDKEPLPLTKTGYRSHFTSAEEIAAAGGPVEYVLALLNVADECGAEEAMRHHFAPPSPAPPVPCPEVATPRRPEPENRQISLLSEDES